uniref:Putative secreted protein n=1 Tax=Amblyomma triste TaxID=251400 RepID=A0A023G332_AMBTT
MASWKTSQWPFFIFILSSPCVLCDEAERSSEKFLQRTDPIFLVGFTSDSIPYVSCIRSTAVTHRSTAVNQPGGLTVRTIQYKEDKDNSGVWEWHSVEVSFTTTNDKGTTSSLSIRDITPLPDEYSAYLGTFPVVYESGECLIIGDGFLNDEGKQRCMAWGFEEEYTSLPDDCQKRYQEKCIEGWKVDDYLLSGCT